MECNNTYHNETRVGFAENIPLVSVLSLYVCVGIIGNSLIIYVYGRRFKNSTTRVFILALAIADGMTCVFLIYKIILLRFAHLFREPNLARLEMVRIYVLQVSIMILPLVSVDRHRRICWSFKKQIRPRTATLLVVLVGVILASTCALRMYLSSGETQRQYRAEALVSQDFINQHYCGTVTSAFYFIYAVLPFCIPLPVMVVMYSLIGFKLRHHFKGQRSSVVETNRAHVMPTDDIILNTRGNSNSRSKSHRGALELEKSVNIQPLPCASDNNALQDISSNEHDIGAQVYDRPLSSSKSQIEGQQHPSPSRKDTHQTINPDRNEDIPSSTSKSTSTKQNCIRERSKNVQHWKRMTLIFFLITVVYIISFLPFLVMFVIFRTDPEHGRQLLNQPLFIVLYNSPYITNVSNFLLYGFFDPRFRRELRLAKTRLPSCRRGC